MNHFAFRKCLLLPLLSVFLLSGAALAADESVAVVEHADGRISMDDVRAVLLGATADQRRGFRESSASAEGLATDLLIRRLIARQAKKEGLDRDRTTALRLELAQEKMLFDLYMERTEAAAIDEKKIDRLARDEYLAYPERYRKEEVRARHILVREAPSRGDDARKVAEGLLVRLNAGEPFDELAKKYSDDPGSAAKGGDLGWLGKGKTVKPFEDALFALKSQGQLSDVIVTQFGFHIIRLDELKPVSLLPYDEVKAQIIEGIKTNVRRQARLSIIGPLKSSESLRLDKDALDEAVGAIKQK